jgi:arginine decarboxylase
MIERTNKLRRQRILIVDDKLAAPSARGGGAIRALADELTSLGLEVVEALSFEEGTMSITSDAAVHCVFVDWTMGGDDAKSHEEGLRLLQEIRRRNPIVPVFLMADRAKAGSFTVEVMSLANEFVWMLEDTAPFVAGRATAAIKRYMTGLLPPFTKALLEYTSAEEESWAAPGHQGGIAFTKSPIGRVFFDFFGENLFRTDSGIERTPLGSLLDHEGPLGEGEKLAARVFGSHQSYSVLNGTSGSNRTIISAIVGDNQIALCDRNCHKSIEQGLVISGGIPVFFRPSRNRYGIIGPIPPSEFDPKSIRKKIKEHPLLGQAVSDKPVYSVVTNCTYDGMCYNAKEVQDILAKTSDVIHFDEAWYGYARFNPIYKDRYAMRGDPKTHKSSDPTIFATHSTHKLLAALSQASYIHIRNGRRHIEPSCFNEAYMAQATTSPLYALAASNEIGAAMMDGPAGQTLTQEVINEAVDFRRALARSNRAFAKKNDWFFDSWNAPYVRDPKSGKKMAFADAPAELLAHDPNCWILHPGEKWHGFDHIPDGWCMLDPIKAGIMCPGMGEDGELEPFGIPAAVLSAYLYRRNIIPSRTTDFMVLCLFSIGVTKGKWATLINTLLNFKADYDTNVSLEKALPDLVAQFPDRYAGMGLKDLSDEMYGKMKSGRMDKAQAEAFASLPKPELLPRQANAKLMSGSVELLPLDKIAGRVMAVSAIPYPPGIPIVMPGENVGKDSDPWLKFLRSMEEWGHMFPGFEKTVEGAVVKDGKYHFWCVKK